MLNYYLLWASGEDRPGIVSAVTATLYQSDCNLEDSAMTRLGSEFGILLIFTSKKRFVKSPPSRFVSLEKKYGLTIGIKKISRRQARFIKPNKNLISVSVHGADKPGIVFHVTQLLAKRKINITDLATHRTSAGRQPGFILFVEGETSRSDSLLSLSKVLKNLSNKLGTHITLNKITPRDL